MSHVPKCSVCLPRGIWFESDKKRYRVRLYRNKTSFLKGYYSTREEAMQALKELQQELDNIPKLPRARRNSPSQAPVPKATMSGLTSALFLRAMFNPNLLKLKR